MRKGNSFKGVIFVVISLFLLSSFVSAGFFSNVFGRLTGNSIGISGGSSYCNALSCVLYDEGEVSFLEQTVLISYIDSESVVLDFNGRTTNKLKVGSIYVQEGIQIEVKEIKYDSLGSSFILFDYGLSDTDSPGDILSKEDEVSETSNSVSFTGDPREGQGTVFISRGGKNSKKVVIDGNVFSKQNVKQVQGTKSTMKEALISKPERKEDISLEKKRAVKIKNSLDIEKQEQKVVKKQVSKKRRASKSAKVKDSIEERKRFEGIKGFFRGLFGGEKKSSRELSAE